MNPTNEEILALVKDALEQTKIPYTFENGTYIFRNWFKNDPNNVLFRIKVSEKTLIILTEHPLYCDKNETEMIKLVNLINCHYMMSSLIFDVNKKQIINKHCISCFQSMPTPTMIRNALLLSLLYFDTFRIGLTDILLGHKAEDVFTSCLNKDKKFSSLKEPTLLN